MVRWLTEAAGGKALSEVRFGHPSGTLLVGVILASGWQMASQKSVYEPFSATSDGG
ncbi:MAG: hypothetical protein U1E98_03750 [Moraxella osloensis]